jgi:transporter family-2 protein
MVAAVLVAAGSGIAIGLQATLNNWSGRLIGPTGTGLLVNLAGGIVALIIMLFLAPGRGTLPVRALQGSAPLLVLVSGALGIGIITGIAYSLPRTGTAAGLSAIIAGQMLIAVLVDSAGWGGTLPIPLSAPRALGLVFLCLGTWLLLPRL